MVDKDFSKGLSNGVHQITLWIQGLFYTQEPSVVIMDVALRNHRNLFLPLFALRIIKEGHTSSM